MDTIEFSQRATIFEVITRIDFSVRRGRVLFRIVNRSLLGMIFSVLIDVIFMVLLRFIDLLYCYFIAVV